MISWSKLRVIEIRRVRSFFKYAEVCAIANGHCDSPAQMIYKYESMHCHWHYKPCVVWHVSYLVENSSVLLLTCDSHSSGIVIHNYSHSMDIRARSANIKYLPNHMMTISLNPVSRYVNTFLLIKSARVYIFSIDSTIPHCFLMDCNSSSIHTNTCQF